MVARVTHTRLVPWLKEGTQWHHGSREASAAAIDVAVRVAIENVAKEHEGQEVWLHDVKVQPLGSEVLVIVLADVC